MKTKALISFAVTAKLICVFDFAYAKSRFSHDAARMAFQTPSASTNAYKCAFFLQAIRDWNCLSDYLISSADVSDDRVSKFASFFSARD